MQALSLSKALYRLRRFSRRIWVRTTAIAALALVAASSATLLAPLVPDEMASALGGSALVGILEILASSMLAVTIFSLSIMVQARQSASTQVTPRSYQLLLEDTTTQSVLATFLGAFVFALVSLIVVSTEVYGEAASAVIMGFTLTVIALVVIALLRWISHLSQLGSLIETSRRVEEAARQALEARRLRPCYGCAVSEPMRGEPQRGAALLADRTGYVQHVDFGALSEAAEAGDGTVRVVAPPGHFAVEGQALALYVGDLDEAALRAAFTLGSKREFDQDPRFGVIVLSEIAQRALSPGINDPGTAIDVIGRLVRVLQAFHEERNDGRGIEFPRIALPAITAVDLMQDGLLPIARDGADKVEVQIRLQKALRSLEAGGGELAAAAKEASREALSRASAALSPRDWQRVEAVVDGAG
ncbi:DUF2254 domain-containing protein [Roseitranquillus sediminis]|uniref:DUF2254 domain-containing protein n=1 Tax=Roseitranquillus sediminis TaxID=2809051 RepID=UPI001D0C865E|nr:DUF2254 domain-containing protein [Roseitranquillus sediminis]MBM9592998.1 DUF2254 domain-containing protein [Roseitranquillus sediminis]